MVFKENISSDYVFSKDEPAIIYARRTEQPPSKKVG